MPKHHRTIAEMMGAVGPVSKKMEVREEEKLIEVIDVTEAVTPPELGLYIIKSFEMAGSNIPYMIVKQF